MYTRLGESIDTFMKAQDAFKNGVIGKAAYKDACVHYLAACRQYKKEYESTPRYRRNQTICCLILCVYIGMVIYLGIKVHRHSKLREEVEEEES